MKRKVNEVLEFLRSQPQKVGSVRLLGVKVSVCNTEDAYKVCEQISQSHMLPYEAHMKSDTEPILSVWYKELQPYLGNNTFNSIAFFAEEVVELFREQKKNQGNIKLLNIKVMLPEGIDSREVSNYIVGKYLEYKTKPKNQGEYPIVAIGYKE